MDNNSNNNISGIPNVSDIKFDDTPAESFENLYGGNQQSAGNVNQGPSVAPVQPSVAPNPGVAPVQPSVAPNPGVAPVQPNVAPNPGVAPVQPNVAPNPGVAPVQPNVAPNPGVAPVQPSVVPNPIPVQPSPDLANMDIDAEKMQSIEEQLSKTSQYNPADFQQEQITIPTDNQSEKGKSGLAFVIVLFIILGVAVILLPQITKMIK